MENEVLIVEWGIDDIMGELRRISLVSEPAIEADFMMFRDVEMKFQTIDEDRRILTGPAMRPGIKIKRYNEMGELYYGTFSEEVVRTAAEIFFKKGSNMNKTNLEHEWEIDGVYVFESWIVEDPEVDKSTVLGFKGVRKGDWFVSMKVDNEVVWKNYLKSGLIKGFSVEARLEEKEVDTIQMIKVVLDSDWEDELKFSAIETLLNKEGCPRTTKSGKPDKRCGDGTSTPPPTTGTKKKSLTDTNTEPARALEKKIRNNPTETGMAYIDGKEIPSVVKENKQRIVILDDAVMTGISGNDRLKMTMTHNHPETGGNLGGSFSPGDFEMSAKYGIGEVRAVDGEYTYSLKWNGGPRDDFSFRGNKESRSIATKHNKNLKTVWDRKRNEIMASKPSDLNAANAEFQRWARAEGTHLATQMTAEEFGFTYTREKI